MGWILGHGKDSSFLSVSDLPLHWDLTLSFEDWKLVLKLVIWLHTLCWISPSFHFSDTEVLLNSRISVSGDQKEDQTSEGSEVKWSEVTQLCPTLCDPMDCSLTRLLPPWDSPGKSTGVGCRCLLQWEGRCALYQENLKRKKIGSEAARERMMEELTHLCLSSS